MRYQDIQINDVELQKQFVNHWFKSEYNEAFNILRNNPQLNSKKFTSECLNLIGQSLLTLEKYYSDNFPKAMKLELDRFNKVINDFIYRQTWNSSTEYIVGNSVVFGDEIYFCIEDNINVAPDSDESKWLKLSLIGKSGNSGIECQVKSQWKSTTQYLVNDIVVNKEWLWIAKQENKNQEPKENSEYWTKFLFLPRIKMYISRYPSDNLYDGLIWIRIIQSYIWEEIDDMNRNFQQVSDLDIDWNEADKGGW